MDKLFSKLSEKGWLALVPAATLLIGLLLRIYLLPQQVIIDDEWHALYYVIGKSPGWLLTHFSIPGATCIPQNFYAWVLFATCGWSEMSLRMPSLVCGLLCLVICPWLAGPVIGSRRAMLLAVLLTVCPLLIFYSRLCRPYSAVAFLAFAAILLAARWRQTGECRYGLLFAAASTLAIYFHLFAAVTVAAPILAEAVVRLKNRIRRTNVATPGQPRLSEWVGLILLMGVLTTVLVLPALIHSLQTTFFKVALTGSFKLSSLPRLAALISGTSQPVLVILFWSALLAGAVEQVRRDPWFGGMLLSLYPLHAIALLVSRPDSAQSAIVLARYCIPMVPVSLLLVACGIQAWFEAIAARFRLSPVSLGVVPFAFPIAFLAAGPLAQCYVAPNNFTNHGAYQHNYQPIDWYQSFYSDLTPEGFPLTTTIRVEEVSPCYRFLAEKTSRRPIVEFPMLIGDHFDPFYYYQHFHRRPVLVGYTRDMKLARGLAEGNIFGNTYIDQVLTLIPEASRLRFRNLVCMDDVDAMRASGAEYVLVHKRFEVDLPAVAPPPPALERLLRKYREVLGEPAYEDSQVAAFALEQVKSLQSAVSSR